MLPNKGVVPNRFAGTKSEVLLQQILHNLSTEDTLTSVLAAVENMRDFEVRLVQDNAGVTWLEVRYWNTQTGTLGAPVYYLAGSTTSGSPALPITYINPNTLLTSILNQLATINNHLNQVTRTPSILTTSGSGSVAAGARSVTVFNRGSATGTFLGEFVEPGEVFTFAAGSTRDVLGALAYDATGTTFVITKIV
jgi:hypothetical protein